jgi:phosphatidate cytidylyltransferase
MFKNRVMSAVVLVILIAVMNVAGGPLMGIMLLLTAEQGLFEFYRTTGVYKGNKEERNILEKIGYCGTAVYFLAEMVIRNDSLLKLFLILCIVFVAMLAAYVLTFPEFDSEMIVKAFFGFMYVPVMLGFIYMTRSMRSGEYMVWMIFISSWICDTCAYLVGVKLGKHRLAPILSPKKSVEGAIGGIVGSALFAVLFSYVFKNALNISDGKGVFSFLLIGAVGAVVSQIGDLAASAFKRNYDVKDYGTIIPGHGGILDRFDSVIFTAPMIYFLSTLFLKL